MKYTNANQLLPKDMIEQIQEYVQGEYIYIPIKDKCVKYTTNFYQAERGE